MIKRGASLVWTVVLCSVLMLITGTMATYIVKESRMSVRMDDSAKAYAAAESGVEWAKRCLQSDACKTEIGFPVDLNAAIPATSTATKKYNLGIVTYEVVIDRDVSRPDSVIIIRSRGASNSVNRRIEHVFREVDTMLVDADPDISDDWRIPQGTFKIPESFTLQFSYWTQEAGGLSALDDVLVGIQGTNTADRIAVLINDNSVDLKIVKSDGGDLYPNTTPSGGTGVPNQFTTYDSAISVAGVTLSNKYALKIKLAYLADTSVRLTVESDNKCYGTKTVFLDDNPFSNLQNDNGGKFLFESTSGTGKLAHLYGSVDHKSRITNTADHFYEFSTPDSAPTNIGYFDLFYSSGIVYSPVPLVDAYLKLGFNGAGSGVITAVSTESDGLSFTCAKSAISTTIKDNTSTDFPGCTFKFGLPSGMRKYFNITFTPEAGSFFSKWEDYSHGTPGGAVGAVINNESISTVGLENHDKTFFAVISNTSFSAVTMLPSSFGSNKYLAISSDNKIYSNKSGSFQQIGTQTLPAGTYNSLVYLSLNDGVYALQSNGKVYYSTNFGASSWILDRTLSSKVTPWVSLASIPENGNLVALNQDGTISPNHHSLPALPAGVYSAMTYRSGPVGTDMFGLFVVLRSDGEVFYEKWNYVGVFPSGTYNYSWGSLVNLPPGGTYIGVTACGEGCGIASNAYTYIKVVNQNGKIYRTPQYIFNNDSTWTEMSGFPDNLVSSSNPYTTTSSQKICGIDPSGQIFFSL